MIIRPVRGRACIESQGLISAEEGLIYSPVLSSGGSSRARGQLRQLSPDQAALSRDTTWRYEGRNKRNRNTRKHREDGRIIKLSDLPTDEEDDTLRGDGYSDIQCSLCSKSACPTDLEAQPSLDPEEGTSERGRSQAGNNKEDEEEEEEDESFPLINETNFGSSQTPSTGIKSLRRQYR